jgi:hypothetical protein
MLAMENASKPTTRSTCSSKLSPPVNSARGESGHEKSWRAVDRSSGFTTMLLNKVSTEKREVSAGFIHHGRPKVGAELAMTHFERPYIDPASTI